MMIHFRRGFAAVLLAGLVLAPASERDSDLERRIRARLALGKLGIDGIQVKVRDGIATLTGSTRTPQRKALATRAARLGGAREVRNQVRVLEMGPVRPAQIVR